MALVGVEQRGALLESAQPWNLVVSQASICTLAALFNLLLFC